MKNRRLKVIVAVTFVTGIATGLYLAHQGLPGIELSSSAHAAGQATVAGGKDAVTFLSDASPTKARPASERQAYFPGTEDLA